MGKPGRPKIPPTEKQNLAAALEIRRALGVRCFSDAWKVLFGERAYDLSKSQVWVLIKECRKLPDCPGWKDDPQNPKNYKDYEEKYEKKDRRWLDNYRFESEGKIRILYSRDDG